MLSPSLSRFGVRTATRAAGMASTAATAFCPCRRTHVSMRSIGRPLSLSTFSRYRVHGYQRQGYHESGNSWRDSHAYLMWPITAGQQFWGRSYAGCWHNWHSTNVNGAHSRSKAPIPIMIPNLPSATARSPHSIVCPCCRPVPPPPPKIRKLQSEPIVGVVLAPRNLPKRDT